MTIRDKVEDEQRLTVLQEIDSNACVLPPEDWPSVIRTTDFPRHLLPKVLDAVQERMEGMVKR